MISDYDSLVKIAKYSAGQGKTVYIMPIVDKRSILFHYYFKLKGAHGNKCPDLLIDGKLFEFKSFTGKFKNSKIGNMISEGVLQSDRIIIDLRKSNRNIRDIKDNITSRVKSGQDIKEVLGLMPDETIITIYP